MDDKIIRATDIRSNFRFFIVRSTNTVEEMRKIHNTSPTATAALGRLSIMAQIIGYDLKNDDDTVTLRVNGGGPAGTLVAVSNNSGNVRSVMTNPQADVPSKGPKKLDVGALVGNQGSLAVIRDYGLKEPWTGVSNLVSGEIAEDFATYFAVSEQQPSFISLGVLVDTDISVKAAGGLMIQPMPFCPESELVKMENALKHFPQISYLMDSGEEIEDILEKYFGEFNITINDEKLVTYECNCSEEKIRDALVSLGREELLEMAEEDGKAEVRCDFCNTYYDYSEKDLKELALESGSKV